jgi:hypothetical protein
MSSMQPSRGGGAVCLSLLVDPVELRSLPRDKLLGLEPEGDLLLSALDAVRSVTYVTTGLDAIIALHMAGSAHGDA